MNKKIPLYLICMCSLLYSVSSKVQIICENKTFAPNSSLQFPFGNCESKINLSAFATQDLSCTSIEKLKWLVKVDLEDNGTFDYEFSSYLPPSDDDLLTDTNNNGIPDRYLAPTNNASEVNIPTFIIGQLDPLHKVSWQVTDGCNKTSECISNFNTKDKKAPTPYCVSLTSTLFENGLAELWCIDYNRGAFDNCTPQNELIFTFNEAKPIEAKIKKEHYFKNYGEAATKEEYENGLAQKWIPIHRSSTLLYSICDIPDLTKISVWDKNRNTDYCSVNISPGELTTFKGKVIKNVKVELDLDLPSCYKIEIADSFFFVNPDSISINSSKTGDYRNGVTTLDMLMIQKHILGISTFTSPEQYIAADDNGDNKVSFEDVILVRKLIYGMIEEFPKDSWVFIPKDYQFVDPKNPFNLPKYFTKFVANSTKVDFIGIKLGDVNFTVNP